MFPIPSTICRMFAWWLYRCASNFRIFDALNMVLKPDGRGPDAVWAKGWDVFYRSTTLYIHLRMSVHNDIYQHNADHQTQPTHLTLWINIYQLCKAYTQCIYAYTLCMHMNTCTM